MRSLRLTRYALSACAVLLLGGCGGGEAATPNSILQFAGSAEPRSAVSRQSGGAFSARYSGHYSVHHACMECAVIWKFRGSGAATFLRRSRERMNWTFILEPSPKQSPNSATITSFHSKADSVTVQISAGYACNGTNSYVVTSGTGRFARATGSGTIQTTCPGPSGHSYTDAWAGTLYY
jgi:hypothetical protein